MDGLRLTEEEYQQYLTRQRPPTPRPRALSPVAAEPERTFQARIVRLAREYGWLVYHTFDSRHSPAGFPDLVLAKPGQPLLCLELKTVAGKVSLEQRQWLHVLGKATGILAQVYHPADYPALVALLSAKPPAYDNPVPGSLSGTSDDGTSDDGT